MHAGATTGAGAGGGALRARSAAAAGPLTAVMTAAAATPQRRCLRIIILPPKLMDRLVVMLINTQCQTLAGFTFSPYSFVQRQKHRKANALALKGFGDIS